MFKECYLDLFTRTDKLYYNYLGISRKEYPRWAGWKIINQYKEKGIHISQIKDKRLEILVQNFYFILYLKKRYF